MKVGMTAGDVRAIHKEFDVLHGEVEIVHAELDRVHDEIEYVHEELDLIHREMEIFTSTFPTWQGNPEIKDIHSKAKELEKLQEGLDAKYRTLLHDLQEKQDARSAELHSITAGQR
jgi:predicted  nucleic acid-binding Zn-ribbon protein